jgi:serine/threonine-protein kinase
MSLTHKEFVKFNQVTTEYQLIKLLNQGGMGAVYLAEDTRLKRKVAIKFLKTETQSNLDTQSLNNKTLQEAQLLARLNHPNIVQIHDVQTFDNFVCIVMEYLQGKNLLQYQRQHISTLTQKLNILADICKGIAHAHNKGVLHCDIKASNILIDQQQTKITDFGISKLSIDKTEKQDASSSTSYGSLTAMSPEQLQNKALDFRSDLFSFGLLAFEWITGDHPFKKASPQAISQHIVDGEAKDALQVIPQLPRELALLLNQLLQKDKQLRPSSAELVYQQLQAIIVAITQQNILAQDTQVFEPLQPKESSLHKVKKLLAATMFILCCGGIYGYIHLSDIPERYVVFLPPSIDSENLKNNNTTLLNAAINESIKQSIVNHKKLNLISQSEINVIAPDINIDKLSKSTLEKIHNATGAQEVITASLNCELIQCSLTLERLTAPNWTVHSRQKWPVVTDSYSYLYNSTGQEFEALYPDFQDTYLALAKVDDQVLQTHLTLYQEIVIAENYSQALFDRIAQLIITAPNLYANYDLLKEVALGLYADSQNEEVLTNAKKILFNSPFDYQSTPSFLYNAAMLAITGHEWQQAENYIKKLRQSDSNLYITLELEGSLYLKKDDLPKAQQAFEIALKLRPNNITKELLATVLWWQGNAEQARKLLESILSISPQSFVANQMLADIALFEGDLETAIKGYNNTISVRPNAIDYSHLSVAYSLQRDFSQALDAIKKALQLYPDNPDYLLNLADMQKATGLIDSANTTYYKVIDLTKDSDDFDDLLISSQAYGQLGNAKSALKSLNLAINIAPDSNEYSFTAALVYSLIGEHQSALLYIEKSLEAGYHPMWLSLPWFETLCDKEEFVSLTGQYNSSVCSSN